MNSLGINPLDVNPQATAVLHMFDWLRGSGVEASYDKLREKYCSDLRAVPVYNCRERGWAIFDSGYNAYHLHQKDRPVDLAFIVVVHRNHDGICVGMWRRKDRLNPPTFREFLDQLPDTVDKWTMWDKTFAPGAVLDAAEWIADHIESEWAANSV